MHILKNGQFRLQFLVGKTIADIVHDEMAGDLYIYFTDGTALQTNGDRYIKVDDKIVESGKV